MKDGAMMDKISVAVIDDDETTVYLYRKALSDKGFQVFGTSSVDDFFSHVRNNHPNVILVDMHMMDMPGWQICQKIKTSNVFEGIKIIGISGIFTEQDDIKKFSVDTDLYFIKPLDLDTLGNAIRRVVKFS